MKTQVLILFMLALTPRLALAQADSPGRNVTCRFVQMSNSTVCDAPTIWGASPKAQADSTPLTFSEEVRLRAREMSDEYVRKGQCDRARKRSVASADPAFIAEIEQRCAAAPDPK